MLRHPLIAIVAVLSIGLSSQAVARSGAGGAGHGGVSAGHAAARVGSASHGAGRGAMTAGRSSYRGYQGFPGYRAASFNGYGRGHYGSLAYTRGYSNSGAYGVAPFGTPTYVASGVFVPGNPTQTPISPPAIYQIEPSGAASRTARGFAYDRHPGIYPVGVSDGVQPSIYVVRVPRG